MLNSVLRSLLNIKLNSVLEGDDGVNDILEIIAFINFYNNNCLDYLGYDFNEEYFFNTYFYNNPMEVARACYFGNYNYNDTYVKFNVYGNLESCNFFDLKEEIKESMDEIIDNIVNLKNELIGDSDILDSILEEYERIERICNLLQNKLDNEGIKNDIECITDELQNILIHENDGFNIDIGIEQEYISYPISYFNLYIGYPNDDYCYSITFNYKNDGKNIKLLNIENINILEDVSIEEIY